MGADSLLSAAIYSHYLPVCSCQAVSVFLSLATPSFDIGPECGHCCIPVCQKVRRSRKRKKKKREKEKDSHSSYFVIDMSLERDSESESQHIPVTHFRLISVETEDIKGEIERDRLVSVQLREKGKRDGE